MTLLAERWGEDVLGFVPAFAWHLVFDREDEILNTGLSQCACLAGLHELELVQGVLVREMDDVDGGSRHIRERYGTMGCFGLGFWRTAKCMKVRRGFAFGEHLSDND